MYLNRGDRLGATVQSSENKLKKTADALAAQRQVYEAEQVQKTAQEATQEFQGTVFKWLPRVAIGVGLLVGGYFVWQKMRRK